MRVLVVDPSPLTAALLTSILESVGHTVTVKSSGAEAVREMAGSTMEAVVLKAHLPEMDAPDLCMELRSLAFNGPILVVGRRCTPDEKVRAFQHGADDFIVEPFDPVELTTRLETVMRRCQQGAYQKSHTVLKIGDVELSLGELAVRVADKGPIPLSPIETQLLEYLMRHNSIIISRQTLISRVWRFDLIGGSNRVDVYIARLRKKLEPNPSQPTYLHTVRGIGYVFRPLSPLRSPNRFEDLALQDEYIGASG
jgi:DNA-binding response OmpR family regulator